MSTMFVMTNSILLVFACFSGLFFFWGLNQNWNRLLIDSARLVQPARRLQTRRLRCLIQFPNHAKWLSSRLASPSSDIGFWFLGSSPACLLLQFPICAVCQINWVNVTAAAPSAAISYWRSGWWLTECPKTKPISGTGSKTEIFSQLLVPGN